MVTGMGLCQWTWFDVGSVIRTLAARVVELVATGVTGVAGVSGCTLIGWLVDTGVYSYRI